MNQVIHPGHFFNPYFVKVSLLGIENVIIFQQEKVLLLLCLLVFTDAFLPEDNDRGLLTFADHAAIRSDLGKCAINPAFKRIC